jgi:lipoprotein-anchoring transpeptidase ErfK/SrfK
MRPTPIARPLVLILLSLTILFVACGGSPASDRPTVAEAVSPTTEAAASATTEPAGRPPSDAPSQEQAPEVTIARAEGTLTVRAQPDDGADVVAELAAQTEFGSQRALLVTERQAGWVRVQLPVRPNGSQGWVPEAAVELVAGEHRVEVDLATRLLTVFEGDQVVLETPIAIGAPDAPTPTGEFAIVDRLQSPDPASPYGPFALGLSAHSDTFSEFAGGDGQIGIHGTDDPASIGQPVSHGCIRVPNDVVTLLAGLLPLGTPVTVV